MIPIEPVILVEGKYDKNKLEQIFEGTILTTDGFGIFKQREKLELLCRLAEEHGLLVFTDADGAGLVIRNFLKGAIPKEKLFHAYIPPIEGKEKRKSVPSKEGFLGVEGVPDEVILSAVRRSGALDTEARKRGDLTKNDLFQLGLSGRPGSEQRRKAVMEEYRLPRNLSSNALLDVLNCITARGELEETVKRLFPAREE